MTTNHKPHINLLIEGPSRGLWRCQSLHWSHYHGASFGKTPADAYKNWERCQAYVKNRPLAFLGVGSP